MTVADDGDIAVEIQSLTPQMARGLGKGAERQIGFTRFQLELELARIQRHRPILILGAMAATCAIRGGRKRIIPTSVSSRLKVRSD
jgi:hypothetical protein